MKLFVVAAIFGVCSAGRLDNTYLPPRQGGFGQGGAGGAGIKGGFGGAGAGGYNGAGAGGFGQGAGGFGQGAGGFGQAAGGFGQGAGAGFGTQHSGNLYNAPASQYSNRQQASADAGAQILRLNSDVTAEGFSYDFETSNGIRADASGVATNGVQSQGSFGYKGDDGQDYSITYTADENGYQPQGAHLPTPPPIPEAILKSLEQNARDEAAGIVDDGTYRGEGAGAGAGNYAANGGYSSGPSAPSGSYGAPARTAQRPSGFGAAAGNGFGAKGAGFGGASGSFGGRGNGFGAANGAGSAFGSRGSSFGGAASRQYLAPNAGPRGSGNGNFNPQTGYQY